MMPQEKKIRLTISKHSKFNWLSHKSERSTVKSKTITAKKKYVEYICL